MRTNIRTNIRTNMRMLIIILILGMLLLTACGKEADTTQKAADSTEAVGADAVISEGSGDPCENEVAGVSGENSKAGEGTDTGAGEKASENAENETTGRNDKIIGERVLPALSTQYLTEDMYERATAWASPDMNRLYSVMKKAQAGEPITVGVIGGSITQGSSAKSTSDSYAALMSDWWREAFPETEITYINAGIGATDSYLGVHRVEEDLLCHNPDFVIVEFSVNDGNNSFYKTTYDNLVRRILLSENEPAVMLLFTTMENGTSAQDNDANIGFTYKLPMLSYRNAVLQEIEAGSFKWTDISPDDIHPNDRGHAIIGELIYRYLNEALMASETAEIGDTEFKISAATKERYMEARLLDSGDIEPVDYGSFEKGSKWDRYSNGWSTETGEAPIIFEVETQRIGLLYLLSTAKGYGQYEIYVDGNLEITLDADFTGGWGSYGSAQSVYIGTEKALHRIEIRLKEGSEGTKFSICGLLIS